MKPFNSIKYILQSINNTVTKTGGVKPITFVDVIWCGMRYGASPNNYFNFDLKNANSYERKTYLTHRKSEYLMRKYNDKSAVRQVEDKYEFAIIMGDKYGRRFAQSKNVTYEELMELFENKRIIYKPLKGGQGIGIRSYDRDSYDDLNALLRILHDLPEGIVEQWITQDEKMSALYPDAVNPIRIQSLFTDSVHIIAATITIANGTNIANASGVKAIFGLVNVENGVVITDGYDYNGNSYITHPVSGMIIKGFQIPHWDEVVQLVKKAGESIPKVRYVGWDVAMTCNGPIIIEANNDPGYTAYQLPILTGTHRGIWPEYKKYIS